MKIRNHKLKSLFLATILFASGYICAQVTVGSDIPATRAALMELKTQQTTGKVTSVIDDANITSTQGGLLLPRVKLVDAQTLEPFISKTDTEFVNNTNSLKEKLAGLMVYNLYSNGSTLYPGVFTWNGSEWNSADVNPAIASILEQPKPFTFYEQGTETVESLSMTVAGSGLWTYQWYQVTGNNVHVRIGEPVTQGTGATTRTYKPTQVIKGTTRNANNTGFYKFYCVAENGLGARLESDIAEIAVGCGAKNNAGEWISFMCFNLGADNNSTISSQKSYNIGSYTNNA
ncbi:hypothetical protein D0T56_16560, partial [Dysgonomonas sp. 520]|nr:hypothetical protein [Dysgonomonas sp. 520]